SGFSLLLLRSLFLAGARRARYFVGMTSVLVDASAIFRKSAGPPRLTPSIEFAAPRSSTHSPQLTQVSDGLPPPISRSDATNFFVVGWSSSSAVVPFTGLACGVWSLSGRQTAPSYANTLT